MNRLLFAFCLATFGLILLRPGAAQAGSFEKLPGAQGKTSPLLMRVVKYQGNTNGAITIEVKNPTSEAQEFTARGIYFVPQGPANEAPQRLGAVGPFQLQTSEGPKRLRSTMIAAGATERMKLDVYCIDSHRASPSSSTNFHVAKSRVPEALANDIDAATEKSAARYGGVSAPAAKPAVQSEVWRNRDKKWIKLEGEGSQEAAKSR
jgi:hypothetical protein